MKARDSKGELKELVIKANDSIPAGSVIDFEGDVVPEGYEQVEDNKIILYENQDGNNGYEIELLDTVEKCVEVEIYGIGDNNIRIYQKIQNPNQATFEMSVEVMYQGREYISKALCGINDKKFYKYQDREYKINISSSNNREVNLGNWLKITKIVGKKV